MWTEDHAVAREMSKIKAIYHVTDLDCWQRLEEVSALANSFMNELPVQARQIMLVHTSWRWHCLWLGQAYSDRMESRTLRPACDTSWYLYIRNRVSCVSIMVIIWHVFNINTVRRPPRLTIILDDVFLSYARWMLNHHLKFSSYHLKHYSNMIISNNIQSYNQIFNYLHILIFYNKKDPTYDNLYEFNIFTDILSKFTTYTQF